MVKKTPPEGRRFLVVFLKRVPSAIVLRGICYATWSCAPAHPRAAARVTVTSVSIAYALRVSGGFW